MTLSHSNPRARQRWLLLGVLVALISLAGAVVTLAVNDEGFFEIDGNSADAGPAVGDDWDTLIGSPCDASPPGSSTLELITCVPDAAPETAFQGGGSKDDNDINLWKWSNAPGGVAPGKDDIQNAYAALYVDGNDDRFVYFGMDVLPSSGTRQVGFWFLQDPDFGVATNGTFSGVHQNNDVLVQSNFTQGGQLTNLSVFKWVDGALVLLSSTAPGSNFGCDTTDTVCVSVNTANVDASWRTGIAGGDFFEGGIKLDGAPINFDPDACLANFVGETRSSAPFSARLKDFATGDFDTCAQPTTIVTTQSSTGVTSDDDIAVTVGASVTDSAVLSGANVATAGGTVTYTLYSNNTCTTSVFDGGTKTVTNGVVPDSDAYTTDTVGTFWWRASYSGDGEDNLSSISACTDEVLTVNKASPTLPTTPSPASGEIGDTLNDSATVTGGYNPTGNVTFNLWGPDDVDCDGTAVYTEIVALVAGTATTSPGFTTTAAGKYAWTASYPGDANNNSASSGCTAEEVVIAKNTPTVSTTQNLIPNDTLTLAGATNGAGGTVDFYLFAPGVTCSLANIANAAYTEEDVAVSSGSASTDNSGTGTGSYLATAEGTYKWLAIYGGDGNNNSATSNCVETFAIDNDITP